MRSRARTEGYKQVFGKISVEDNIIRHIYASSKHIWKCERCGEQLSSKKEMRAHLYEVHSY